MGTKQNPGAFDCYANALPNEPMFVLLARDPDFHRLVSDWAQRRELDILCGLRPDSDLPMVAEAQFCALAGRSWRKENNGKWRDKSPVPPPEDWRQDPAADERWNAGVDFAMKGLRKALSVDPALVTWDAATETVDGDVQAVIWNILRARMGDNWDPDAAPIGGPS